MGAVSRTPQSGAPCQRLLGGDGSSTVSHQVVRPLRIRAACPGLDDPCGLFDACPRARRRSPPAERRWGDGGRVRPRSDPCDLTDPPIVSLVSTRCGYTPAMNWPPATDHPELNLLSILDEAARCLSVRSRPSWTPRVVVGVLWGRAWSSPGLPGSAVVDPPSTLSHRRGDGTARQRLGDPGPAGPGAAPHRGRLLLSHRRRALPGAGGSGPARRRGRGLGSDRGGPRGLGPGPRPLRLRRHGPARLRSGGPDVRRLLRRGHRLAVRLSRKKAQDAATRARSASTSKVGAGQSRLSSAIFSRSNSATAQSRYHFLSAGMTYQGAASGLQRVSAAL